MCCLQETHFKYKDSGRLKVKVWRKLHYASTNQKKAEIAILISYKENFRIRKIIMDKQKYYVFIMEAIL